MMIIMLLKKFREVKYISYIYILAAVLNSFSMFIIAVNLILIKNPYGFLLIAPIAVSLTLIINWLKIINNSKVFNYDLDLIKKIIIHTFFAKVALQFDIVLLILCIINISLSLYFIFTLNQSTIGTITLLPTCLLPGMFIYIANRFKNFED